MSTTLLIFLAFIVSTVCAHAAANFARKQGRNPAGWAVATFFLPALLLLLMKVDGESQADGSNGD